MQVCTLKLALPPTEATANRCLDIQLYRREESRTVDLTKTCSLLRALRVSYLRNKGYLIAFKEALKE